MTPATAAQWEQRVHDVAQVPAGEARIVPTTKVDGSPAWSLIIIAPGGRLTHQLVFESLPQAMLAAETAPPAELRDRVLTAVNAAPIPEVFQ